MTRRVVVTGVGLVSALGIGTEETWKNILASKSGVGPITHFDTAGFSATIAAEVRGFDPLQFIVIAIARLMLLRLNRRALSSV